MATIHHKPCHHSTTTATATSSYRPRRHSLDYSTLPSTLKHSTTLLTNNNHTISYTPTPTPTFSFSTSTSTFTPTTSLDTLENHLTNQNFRQADEETRRLLIVLAGEAAIKRGYVFFSEVQFIPKEDLKAIDELWLKFSNGKFGYSVQKKILVKVNNDFTRFFKKVGWLKKLDTEVEQYNYRSFPSEFMWQLNNNNNEENNTNTNTNNNINNDKNEVTPEGHLPLTNALRGTQLLSMILSHPAFDDDEKIKEENEDYDSQVVVEEENNNNKKKSTLASLRDKLFKQNYSF